MEKVHKKYLEYRKLSSKEKKRRIDNAQQSQAFRKPNPQGQHKFPENNFIDFVVEYKGKQYQLHTYRYKAKQSRRAVIVMFHGLNSHCGHGAHLAYHFSQAGVETVGFDYLGFGRSQGPQGFTDSLEVHLEDCFAFVKKIKEIYPGDKIFALGLSMGGMTSYHLTLKNPHLFQGAILMAPALKNSVGGFLVGLTNMLSKILPKGMRLIKPIYGKAAKNPQITDFVQQDPYSFKGRARLSTLSMLVQTMDKSPATFKQYQSPFIVFQGGLDKMVNPQVAFQLYDQSKTKQEDKQIYFYQNMWHDIWHEDEIFQIINLTIKWIESRISKGMKQQQSKQIMG